MSHRTFTADMPSNAGNAYPEAQGPSKEGHRIMAHLLIWADGLLEDGSKVNLKTTKF